MAHCLIILFPSDIIARLTSFDAIVQQFQAYSTDPSIASYFRSSQFVGPRPTTANVDDSLANKKLQLLVDRYGVPARGWEFSCRAMWAFVRIAII